jgi:hypothetical protein
VLEPGDLLHDRGDGFLEARLPRPRLIGESLRCGQHRDQEAGPRIDFPHRPLDLPIGHAGDAPAKRGTSGRTSRCRLRR